MTSQKIKFYKLNSSSEKLAGAKTTEGAIIYVVDARELWIGGATPKLVIKGANDVTFANNVLTITHYDNAGTATTQTLNFSDVASASQTMAVFQQIYNKMGLTGDKHDTIDYTGTHYLTSATTLVDGDKALDTAIYNNSLMGTNSGAVYDTEHLSKTWSDVVGANAVVAADTVRDGVEKVDKKVARLADEVIINEEVTQQAFAAVANSVGLEQDMSLDLKDASLQIIKDDTSVKKALIDLDNYVATKAGKVDDVQVNGTTIVSNKVANLAVDGTYNASTNKVASQDTVKNAIDAIAGAGLAVDNAGVITATTQATADDTTNVATTEFVHNVIETLDTTADVHDVVYTAPAGDAGAKLTFKGVSEADGKIAQGTGTTELQFAKVATTGAAADVTIADAEGHTEQTTVEGAIDEIYDRVKALEGSFDVIKSVDAGTTPAGVKWMDGQTEITGTLPASATTFHKVYLVPAGGSEGSNTYSEYITTKQTSGSETTYGWEKLGDIAVDLTGYVKSVTVNGKTYTVDTDSTNITLTDVITAITGETGITGGNTDFVKVTATTTKTEANGTNVTALSTTAKVQAVATADASNQGLAEASDVKAYVDGEIQKLDVAEYAQAEITTTEGASTLKVKSIKEVDGKIAAGTDTPTFDVAIDGVYDASTNKVATQSTVTNVINGLDADITSNDNAVATVEVVETDGKITDVVVTNVSAGVTYTASEQAGGATGASADLTAGSSAAAQAGAVTGADIAAIKSYVDDKSAMCWEEYEN